MTTNFNLRSAALAALFLQLGIVAVRAQAFEVGTNALNLGIGVGGYRFSYLSSYNDRYTVSPTFCASFERGVSELGSGVLGVGGFAAYKSVTYNYTSTGFNSVYTYDQKWSNTVLGVRGAWHPTAFLDNPKLDLYGGVMLGYNIGSYTDRSTYTVNGVARDVTDNYNYKLSYVTWSTFVGGRYLFTDRIGAYLELGYGISYLNLGATLKI